MPVKLEIKKQPIVQKFQGRFDNMVLPILTEEIAKDANTYVKVKSHQLEASMNLHSRFDEGLIIWQTPYAARQFWEIETAHTDKNPNASWKWALVAKQNHMPEWMEKLRRLMNSDGLGGSK